MQPSTLENWLKDHLRARNLTQRQLAVQAEIAAGMISKIGRGHVPGPDVLVKLADFFGEDIGTLMEIAGILQLTHLPDERRAELKSVVGRLYRLPAQERQAILQQVEALLDLLKSGWTLQPPDQPDGDAPAGSRLIAESVRLEHSAALQLE